MAFEQREGSGALFRNDKKTSPNQPDFRGDAMFNGQLIELAIWSKETSKGSPMLSVSIKAKQAYAPKQESKPGSAFTDTDQDLDIPF